MKSITELVKEFIAKKDIKPSQLARLCSTTEGNMIKKLKKHDMDSSWVARISTGLKHDFFADLSFEWKKEHLGEMVVSEPGVGYGKSQGPLEDYIEQIIRKVINEKKNNEPLIFNSKLLNKN